MDGPAAVVVVDTEEAAAAAAGNWVEVAAVVAAGPAVAAAAAGPAVVAAAAGLAAEVAAADVSCANNSFSYPDDVVDLLRFIVRLCKHFL